MSDILAQLTAALADRYRIDRELGAGGMATVYLAEDLKHRRKVAIKVLADSVVGADRFLREIETTANLRHPHILPLYLAMLAREADAMSASRILVERDPLSPVTWSVVSMTQLSFGRREEALASARRAVELDSTGPMPRAMLASAELAAGHREAALRFARTAVATPTTTPWIAWALAGGGEQGAAADLVRDVLAKRDRHGSANVTAMFAALGSRDTTAAMEALESAVRERDALGFMAPFGLPAYDPIRASSRFAAAVRAFGADPAAFARPMGDAR